MQNLTLEDKRQRVEAFPPNSRNSLEGKEIRETSRMIADSMVAIAMGQLFGESMDPVPVEVGPAVSEAIVL